MPEQAADAAEPAVDHVELTINHAGVYARFMEGFECEVRRIQRKSNFYEAEQAHRILSSLNMALQSIGDTATLENFRKLVHEITGELADFVHENQPD